MTWPICSVGRVSSLGVTVKGAAEVSRMRELCALMTLLKGQFNTSSSDSLVLSSETVSYFQHQVEEIIVRSRMSTSASRDLLARFTSLRLVQLENFRHHE